jgi:hypothetical protein
MMVPLAPTPTKTITKKAMTRKHRQHPPPPLNLLLVPAATVIVAASDLLRRRQRGRNWGALSLPMGDWWQQTAKVQ